MGSTNVQAPTPIDPAKAGADSLKTQIELAPQQFAAEAQFAPQYSQLYSGIMRDTLLGTANQPGLLSTYSQAAPQMGDLQASMNTAQRQADIKDVTNLGTQAVQAFQQANPELMKLQGMATNQALNPQQMVSQLGMPQQFNAQMVGAGDNQLLGQLNQSVSQQLGLGGQLSPYEQAQAVNATQSQMNMYGRQNDPMAAAAAALNLDAVSQNRLMQRQQAASGVASQNQQQNALGLQAGMANQQAGLGAAQFNAQTGLGYGTANQQAQLQNANFNQQQLMQAAGLLQSTSQDPYAMILGRSSGVGQLAGMTQQASSMPTSTSNFNPFNQSIMDIYAGNNANQLAASTASANASASMWGGMFQGLGALGGGMASGGMFGSGFGNKPPAGGGCWVARECYGEQNPRWMVFRLWLFTNAPKWFLHLYITYGERFAAYIHNKPIVKSLIRKWMDSRIAKMEVA